MNRILVTGGRDFTDQAFVWGILDWVRDRLSAADNRSPVTLLHGCARGADTLASDWAKDRGVSEERYPADWEKHGKAAGLIRNAKMVMTRPDVVVVFPGGRGTAHCKRIAQEAGLTVFEPTYPPVRRSA